MKKIENKLENMNPKSLASIMFGLGLGLGLILMIFGLLIQSSYLKSDTYLTNESNIQNDPNQISKEDVVPDISVMTSFNGTIKKVISEKEIIVEFRGKQITVNLDDATKVTKQRIKTGAEQMADKAEYDKKRAENKDAAISPPLPFEDTEMTKQDLIVDKNVLIISDSNIIGKSEVKANTIRITN